MSVKRLKYLVWLALRYPFAWYLYQRYFKNNDLLKEDLIQNIQHRGKNKPKDFNKAFIRTLIYYPEYALLFFWRINSNFFLWNWLFPKKYYCKLFKSTQIDGGMVCYHPYATVINAKKIGKNFTFRNAITIGNKNNQIDKIPVIGNNVEVGANAVIIGDIYIGDNVIIGAGSVVVKDVPSNCVVAGNPAKVIKTL
ncbi:MAG: serine acetyltransferase [Candidatus Kapabacteria bacterium]|jgi:serine O-acetyltransferase|nr:serine acetyltransferase [Candidatus Kapabacteria bacterium]